MHILTFFPSVFVVCSDRLTTVALHKFTTISHYLVIQEATQHAAAPQNLLNHHIVLKAIH